MKRQDYKLQWASKDLGQSTRVALGDVNGDGIINIVAGTAADVGSSHLHVFRFQGKTYHQLAKASLGDYKTRCIKTYDIDRDGRDEIIIGTQRGLCLYVMSGSSLSKVSEISFGGEVTSIVIADIDSDGHFEIIVAVSGKPNIYIVRYQNRRLVLVRQESFPHKVWAVACGDTDGDGHKELVIKCHAPRGSTIYVLSFVGGRRREKWSRTFHDGRRNFLVVDDLNKDGRCEIVFGCSSKKVRIIRYGDSGYDVFWESPSLAQDPVDVAVYDVDGDGGREVAIICLGHIYIYGWKKNTLILEWTQVIPNGVCCIKTGELNHKGYGEVVLGTIYGYIYVMEPRRDPHRGKLWVGKVQTIVQDTVEIPTGKPDAERGIEAKARFSIDEVKVIYDKVIVDGTVYAKILYVAALPSQPVHFFEASFPFMDFIHLYGAEPGMEALVHFKTEHINVDAVSPRRIKVTILFEMIVKLVSFYHHDHYHKDHYYKDHFHGHYPHHGHYPDP